MSLRQGQGKTSPQEETNNSRKEDQLTLVYWIQGSRTSHARGHSATDSTPNEYPLVANACRRV